MDMNTEFNPSEFEPKWASQWLDAGCFKADVNSNKEPFTIMIPPPNVTGRLHVGHALGLAIQDAMIRYRRMQGKEALWVPGTDHAGIATQTVVEKSLAKQGLKRQDLGREKFLERVWEWKHQHAHEITDQIKRFGASVDWDRERFTMDANLSVAVTDVFVRLYEEGLIYRGNRLINWCIRCQTALSDLEVIPTDRQGSIWHIRYPIFQNDGKTKIGEIEIATTRPETLLGDTAVAIHPDDERYRQFHGAAAKVPLMGRLVPVILDAYVDQTFGSGALKVTPAHDFADEELGARHKLPSISIIDKFGILNEEAGHYKGLSLKAAREKILEDLQAQELLIKTEPHINKVGLCQRCDSVVEPLLSQQWFVKMAPLAEKAIRAVKSKEIEIAPASWEKTFDEWMRNIRDWCISRQLWWGHQIPVWHCQSCEGFVVAKAEPTKCTHCSASPEKLVRDPDVLDTWFSSALWPFTTLGWPKETADFKKFYPTSVLETGFDILFFWVARMMMMGIHLTGKIPFNKVYLHALVRDAKGEKMSKSKGNVVDPMDIIQKHGSDALRFTLISMAGQNRDVRLSDERVEGYRAFGNKLWNATKFFHILHGQNPDVKFDARIPDATFSFPHRWLRAQLREVIAEVSYGLENFELDRAHKSLYQFSWMEFCDWYIEICKIEILKNPAQTLNSLQCGLDQVFRLLHPFMPFVTEELWQSLPINKGQAKYLMLQSFPKIEDYPGDEDASESFEYLKLLVNGIRNFRGENQISPKIPISIELQWSKDSSHAQRVFEKVQSYFVSLAKIEKISGYLVQDKARFESVISIERLGLQMRVPLAGLVDPKEEVKRLNKERDKALADLAHVEKKLSNAKFIEKAPPELLSEEKQKKEHALSRIASLDSAVAHLAQFGG